MRTIRDELDTLPPLGDVEAALSSARGGRRPGRVPRGGVLVAAAAAVVVVVGGMSLLGGPDVQRNGLPAGNPEARQPVEPDTIQKAFLDAVTAAAGGNVVWQTSSVQALDSRDEPLEGAARVNANRWQGIFRANDSEELRLILIEEAPMSADEARQDCAERFELGHAATCEVSLDGDIVVQQITRGAKPDPEGWPVVLTQNFASRGEELWLMQQTILRDPSGTTVYVAEVVKATTWNEAADSWILERSDLDLIAAEINLPIAK